MQTQVKICNIALALLGGKFLISSIDEDTAGARLCKANYEATRDAVLEECDWSFATVEHNLSPDTATSVAEGLRKFKLPAETLRILTVFCNGSPLNEWSMQQRFILARVKDLVIRSIDRVGDPNQYSQGFIQAFATRLAADMAMPLTNSAEMHQVMWSLYGQKVQIARINDGLQGTPLNPYKHSRIIRARRGA